MAVTRKCPSGKSPFHSQAEAKHALSRIRASELAKPRQERSRVLPRRAYLCPLCHRWHLTHTTRYDEDLDPAHKPRPERQAPPRPAAEYLPEPTVTDDQWTWRASA